MTQPTEQESRKKGYQLEDAQLRPILYFGLGIVALMVLALAVMVPLQDLGTRAHVSSYDKSPLSDRVLPDAPRLQVVPGADLKAWRAQEEEVLHNYAWVDRDLSRVRVPIDKAMEMVARRGLPGFGAMPVVVASSGDGTPQDTEVIDDVDGGAAMRQNVDGPGGKVVPVSHKQPKRRPGRAEDGKD